MLASNREIYKGAEPCATHTEGIITKGEIGALGSCQTHLPRKASNRPDLNERQELGKSMDRAGGPQVGL